MSFFEQHPLLPITQYIERDEAESNPQGYKEVMDKLCNVDITFAPKVFEYRGPKDFIFYKLNTDRDIVFAMKVLCSEHHFKIVKLYHKNQVDLFLCLVEFRNTIREVRGTDIDSGYVFTILWDNEVCTEEIKTFARLSNIMEEDKNEFKINSSNKTVYYGKSITFPSQSAASAPSTTFANPHLPTTFANPQSSTTFATSPLTQPSTSFATSPLTQQTQKQPEKKQEQKQSSIFSNSVFSQPKTQDKPQSVFTTSFGNPSTSFTKSFTSFGK